MYRRQLPFLQKRKHEQTQSTMKQEIQNDVDAQDYQSGFRRVMWLAEQARYHGWQLSDRQLVFEIIERERAAQIREKSSLPILGVTGRTAAWNRGQADALRELLREQREHYGKGL